LELGAELDAVSTIHCRNRRPVADAGADQTLECEGGLQATALLDGSTSSDPDSTPGTNDDIVTYAWLEDGATLATSVTPAIPFGLGAHDLTLTVADRAGATGFDEVIVAVRDTTPPTIVCPASVRVECQAAGRAVASVPLVTGEDSCFGAVSIENDRNDGGADASNDYPLGTTMVTFTATDGAGNRASCSTSITVEDTTPPVVSVQASPDILGAPDHRMRAVHLTVVAVDACGGSYGASLQSITSSEPDDRPGASDGTTRVDIQGASIGTPDFDVLLRAERDLLGPGRTYSVRYRSTDAQGNVGVGVGTVAVPPDQGRFLPRVERKH
jgi:hypothetical protein